MKTLSLLLIIAAVTVRLETETPVTLHITDVSSSRYVTAGNKGALDSSSKRIGPKQTFTLVDTNDGKMEDGNTVRIKWNTTYWQEDRANGKVVRCPGKEMDATTCTFKVKKQGQLIALQTASGKFVSAPTDGTALVTTNTRPPVCSLHRCTFKVRIPYCCEAMDCGSLRTVSRCS